MYRGELTHVRREQFCRFCHFMEIVPVTLSGSGGKQFRGFLVQARTVADGSPVGAFADIGQDQALSCCTPAEVLENRADSESPIYIAV